MASSRSIRLGTNTLSGREIYLPIQEFRKTHTHILGGSGVGKTRLLDRISRDIIKAGYPIIVLDGKGELYERLLRFVTLYRVKPDRLFLIDPNEAQSVGINVLERIGDTDPYTQAGLVVDGLKKMHEDEETRVWLEEWGRAALAPLSSAGFTLLEGFEFARADRDDFRAAVLDAINDPMFTKKWEYFQATYPKGSDRARVVQAFMTRIDLFLYSPFLRAMFGQKRTTIDWREVMDGEGIVLAQLGQGTIDPKALSFIGVAMINQIVRTARMRPTSGTRPCFVLLDEFQRFLTPDLAEALDQLRGFGVHFIMAHQNLSQTREEDRKIYASVQSNARNKMTFAVMHEDAEVMANELFGSQVYKAMQEEKRVIKTKFLTPKESTREIHGASRTEGEGETAGMSHMETAIPEPDGSIKIVEADGGTTGNSFIRSSSASVTRVPWYEYEEDEQISSVTYYNEAEVLARFMGWIQGQDERRYQLKIRNRPAIPMLAPTVEDIHVRDQDVAALKEKVYSLTARSLDEVKEEIDARIHRYLDNTKPKSELLQFRHKVEDPSLKPPQDPPSFRMKKA